MKKYKPIILIGYSGHAYVIYDIFRSMGRKVTGYCENELKKFNPFNLDFYGKELSQKGLEALKNHSYFIAIGSNDVRAKIQAQLIEKGLHLPTNAIHSSAVISSDSEIGKGVMISANVSVNPFATIGNGVICNTGCIIEHENQIGDYAHIGPGAVLCGNVSIGVNAFIGANAVVKQGIKIGDNAIIGAGTVVLNNVTDKMVVVGNPQRMIKKNKLSI